MSNPVITKVLEMVNKGEWQLLHITTDELTKIIGKNFGEAIKDPESLAVLHKLQKGVVYKRSHQTEANTLVDCAPMPFTKEEVMAEAKPLKTADGTIIQWIKRNLELKDDVIENWIELFSKEGLEIYTADLKLPPTKRHRQSEIFEIPAIGGINYKGGAAQLVEPVKPTHRIVGLNAQHQWHAVPAVYPSSKNEGSKKQTKTQIKESDMKAKIMQLLNDAKKSKDKEQVTYYSMLLDRFNK